MGKVLLVNLLTSNLESGRLHFFQSFLPLRNYAMDLHLSGNNGNAAGKALDTWYNYI